MALLLFINHRSTISDINDEIDRACVEMESGEEEGDNAIFSLTSPHMGRHENTYTHFCQGKIMKIFVIYSNISYANESYG
jgi:hypothetical protein